MSDQMKYHSIDELQSLSFDELQALWELVPTERQRAYRTAYDREVRNAGAIGSDDLERRVAAELLNRYVDSALVPVGSRWARTPERVQDAARDNALPETSDTSQAAGSGKPSPVVIAVVGGIAVVFILLIVFRLLNGGKSDDVTEIVLEASATPTVAVSPTPTPLALEAQDDVITGGDSEREIAYPVNLQVVLPDSDSPRVWVVQRREVRAAEWNYDPNPDIASFVNGMSVRPVIGIPWSVDNVALFDSIESGVVFHLTMNTGATLRYEFVSKTDVRRSDTTSFRQISPGLVLLLMGEADENGLPTGTRTLVTAAYPSEQELSRTGELIPVEHGSRVIDPTPTPEETAIPFAGIDVQLISVTTQPGKLTTVMRIYNGGNESQSFTSDDIWLALGYMPNPVGPRVPAEGLQSFELQPEQAVDLTMVWYWVGEPFGALQIGDYRFTIQFS